MGKKKPGKKVPAAPRDTLRGTEDIPTESTEAERDVRFVFHALEAREVFLTGEFNNWDTGSLPMKKIKGGEWQAEVHLAPGRYEYNFFVDGIWVQDPACHQRTVNPFGTQNCIIQVS